MPEENCECGGDCLSCEVCEAPECECACEMTDEEDHQESEEEW